MASELEFLNDINALLSSTLEEEGDPWLALRTLAEEVRNRIDEIEEAQKPLFELFVRWRKGRKWERVGQDPDRYALARSAAETWAGWEWKTQPVRRTH